MSCSNSCVLNYDNAPCIPVRAKTDTSIEFSVLYPTEIDLSMGTFVFMLSEDERGDCRVMTIQQGEGLDIDSTADGYTVSLFIKKDHGLVFGNYFGEVRHDIDGDNASIILKVQLEIESSIARLS